MQAKKAAIRSLFIFRRDLRLDDNTGLLYALANSDVVFPVFIFDKKQVNPERNSYFGSNCVQFMSESLVDLDGQIKKKGGFGLNILTGNFPDIFKDILNNVKPNFVCVNMDYTPYSKERDSLIKDSCEQFKVEFKSFEDICLNTIEQAKGNYNGDVFYKKFTPYYNSVVNHKIKVPVECKATNFSKDPIEIKGCVVRDFGKSLYQQNDRLIVNGGRTQALQVIGKINLMKNYATIRNDLTQTTSLLSAYNKFGCLSIREVYHTSKAVLKDKAEAFLRQLYWRDFYYYIAYFFPHVFSGPMKPSYSQIPWDDSPAKLQAWQDGKCGCPIVDAAMRQLNTVGWMPNRVRMIVSNYLIKDLHINWQDGERYFANKLVDYDPSQNNGGWQWSSGSGVDSQPYFRIFNPVLQMQKFDPKCIYIKKWIPELKDVPAEDIHNWETTHQDYKKCTYPAPLVKHSEAKERLIQMYKASFDATADDKQDSSSDYDDPKPTSVRKGELVDDKGKKKKDGKKSTSAEPSNRKGKASNSVGKPYGVKVSSRVDGENDVMTLLGKRVKPNPTFQEPQKKNKK